MKDNPEDMKNFEGSISFNIDGALAASLKKILAEQEEYFRTMMFIRDNSSILDAVGKNSLKLPLSEQLLLYRAHKKLVEVAISLNNKYRFLDTEEDDRCY